MSVSIAIVVPTGVGYNKRKHQKRWKIKMYLPHERDFESGRNYRWLKTAFMSVFVAVTISVATTATAVWWSDYAAPSGSAGTYDPTAAQQMPKPADLGSQALDQPAGEIDRDSGLQQVLDEFTDGQAANLGIYAENLQTGQTAIHKLDRTFPAYGLAYLFIAHEILRELDTGILTTSQSAGLNSGLTIQQCLTQMLTADSTACATDLGNILGWEVRDSELHRLGYTSTTLIRNSATTSARNIALLYKNLAEGRHLSLESRETLLGLLRNQPSANRVAYGLPQLTKVAHQPAGNSTFAHDGGTVYSYGGDYILIILSGPWQEPESTADQKLGELSQKVYGYFNN